MTPLRACLGCGRPTPAGKPKAGTRCPDCQREHNRRKNARRPKRAAQRAFAREVLADPNACCWICGRPPTPDDPLEADHIVPHADGGPTVPANGRPAHRSCNRGRRA